MENRRESVVPEAVSEEKYPNRFKPGQSGNPAGRPKKTKEEEALLEQLKKLTPLALQKMEQMLSNDRVAALAKVRIIEIILERTFGKVENPVKVTNVQHVLRPVSTLVRRPSWVSTSIVWSMRILSISSRSITPLYASNRRSA